MPAKLKAQFATRAALPSRPASASASSPRSSARSSPRARARRWSAPSCPRRPPRRRERPPTATATATASVNGVDDRRRRRSHHATTTSCATAQTDALQGRLGRRRRHGRLRVSSRPATSTTTSTSSPNTYLPYPGKRPYPNALFADADVDYDGDSLTLGEEYSLWKYATAITHGLDAAELLGRQPVLELYRSRTATTPAAACRRCAADTYDKQADFLNWASAHGYRRVDAAGRHALVRLRSATRNTLRRCSTSTARPEYFAPSRTTTTIDARRLPVRRRARRGRRRPHELRRGARPHAAGLLGRLLRQREAVRRRLRRHRPRRPGHRRRRRARRRGRPGPRRHPEHRRAEPQRGHRSPVVELVRRPRARRSTATTRPTTGRVEPVQPVPAGPERADVHPASGPRRRPAAPFDGSLYLPSLHNGTDRPPHDPGPALRAGPGR